jgi:S-adenosylmethionine hydrolase
MPIVTLTTDLGLTDYYVAAVKGSLISAIPDVTIVDITHEIPKHDSMKAAFNLKSAYSFFPKGSIHIMSVNSIETEQINHIVFEFEGHYFIGADNGVFSIVTGAEPKNVYAINKDKKNNHNTFPTKDVFIKVAAHIAKGGKLDKIGYKINSLRKALMPAATVGDDYIRGNILYVDDYGNLITNISKEMFDQIGDKKSFGVYMRTKSQGLNRILDQYEDVGEGDAIVLFNSLNLMEIAINKGNASKLFGMKPNETVRIEFQ